MPKVEVSEYVKGELERIKDEEEHKSFDSVIRMLVGNYNP